MMGAGMKMKKVVIFKLKRCYVSICNHLFLVGFLFSLVFVYKTFPFLFSMLVSGSPVLVCTLVLLSALLSFGKPNIPEIESDNRETDQVVLLKAAFSDDSILERNESESVNKLIEITNATGNYISKVGLDHSYAQFVATISQEKELDDRAHEEGRIEENQYSLITEDDIDLDEEHNDESLVGFVDSKEVNVNNLDSHPGSPWKHVDEDDGEALGSGPRGAESPSPDASMADITIILDELQPLLDENASQPANITLDELHPLLDEETSQPPYLSPGGSNSSSELFVTSNESSSELDDNTDNCEELKVPEDDDEDEKLNEDKGDQTKCAITWTEEDQKNLMDLGKSELERNQRLENLIARRRARRCFSMVTEKNLIDLDITDPPSNVPRVSTTRTNPFDLPPDSYENMGFHPIPGSAPCKLLPKKNPFDLPYESREEKPNVMEGSVQQEFIPLLPKDPFLHRRDSFNVQPSFFGRRRTEKQVMGRFRPYFVSELLGSEGPSCLPIHTQSSEVSDSKESSVSDTESVSSIGDMEEKDGTEDEAFFNDAEDEGDNESMTGRYLKMIKHSDIECDSAGDKFSCNDVMVLIILWLLQNPQDGELDPLEKSGQKPSHNDDKGAIEPSVPIEECVREVSNVERVSCSASDSHAGDTNEDIDVGSDREESDVKYTMQNAPEDTGFPIKTPPISNVGAPDISNKKEKSSNRSSTSSSSSSSSSYASMSHSDRD